MPERPVSAATKSGKHDASSRGRSHPRAAAPAVTPHERIAIATYSVKPRGGAVHSVELAEALAAEGVDVSLVALGDPAEGFFRPTGVPVHIIESPPRAETLTERVFSHIEAMTAGLAELDGRFDIVHTQDCISARAAARVRDRGARFRLIRTVHHIDDFTTPALVECQDAAIVEPDRVLVVSDPWRRLLLTEYGIEASVVTNGVRVERFAAGLLPGERARLRDRISVGNRHLFLTVGGIEPRKGSRYLVEALGLLKAGPGPTAMLAVVGGHSFQDYRAYRDEVLGSLGRHGLRLDDDVVLLGTVTDEDLPRWFGAADSFVFPSVSEGWGLVVLEALAAGLPVVASDIEVFQSFLTEDRDAVLTEAANPVSLAAGMARVRDDTDLVHRLRDGGRTTAYRYSWSSTALQHMEIYAET